MKLGIIHTSTTQKEKQYLQEQLIEYFGSSLQLYEQENPEILMQVNQMGAITPECTILFLEMYVNALKENCDMILSTCTAIGELSDSMTALINYANVPIISIEQEMCSGISEEDKRVAIIGTNPMAIERVHNVVMRKANFEVEILDKLIILPETSKNKDKILLKEIKYMEHKIDAILLAQPSLSDKAQWLQNMTRQKVKGCIPYAIDELNREFNKRHATVCVDGEPCIQCGMCSM